MTRGRGAGARCGRRASLRRARASPRGDQARTSGSKDAPVPATFVRAPDDTPERQNPSNSLETSSHAHVTAHQFQEATSACVLYIHAYQVCTCTLPLPTSLALVLLTPFPASPLGYARSSERACRGSSVRASSHASGLPGLPLTCAEGSRSDLPGCTDSNCLGSFWIELERSWHFFT